MTQADATDPEARVHYDPVPMKPPKRSQESAPESRPRADGASQKPQSGGPTAATSADVLRALVDNMDEAVVALGVDGNVVFANAAAVRLYGIDPQGPPVAEWSKTYGIYLPDHQTLWPAEDLPGTVALRGQTVDGEQYIRPAGASTGYWVRVRARPFFGAKGEVQGALLTWRDVSEEKKTAENQRRLLAIVENAPDLVSLTDPTLKTSYMNGAGRELLGLGEKEDVHSFPVLDADFEDQRERFDSEILPVLLRGEPWNGEFRLRHAQTGEPITVDMRAFGIFGAYGQLLGFAGISRDITARRQAEQTRQRLASIVEFSRDAIISESLDGVITTWNRGAELMFGYSSAEAVGKPITMLSWPGYEEDMRELLRRVGTEEVVEHYETLRRHKDGRQLVISLTLSPVRDSTGKLVGDIENRAGHHGAEETGGTGRAAGPDAGPGV